MYHGGILNCADDLGEIIDICGLPLCGKGKCQQQPGLFNFTCDCDSGWKTLKVGPIESCVLPNCEWLIFHIHETWKLLRINEKWKYYLNDDFSL